MDYQVEKWDESFARGENAIFYPQTRVVQFINRYVRKKKNETPEFFDIISTKNRNIRCLDFACGIGTHSFFCNEMGLDVVGIDISRNAIEIAKVRWQTHYSNANMISFSVIDNNNAHLNFSDNQFDVTIAESCLDSMHFAVAKAYMSELCRVTEKIIYCSLIGSDMSPSGLAEDKQVETEHENGTIQSYFDRDRINQLIANNQGFNLISCVKVTERDSADVVLYQRYYCILAVT